MPIFYNCWAPHHSFCCKSCVHRKRLDSIIFYSFQLNRLESKMKLTMVRLLTLFSSASAPVLYFLLRSKSYVVLFALNFMFTMIILLYCLFR
ncbi:hypothetical protein EB796_001444 [Bugula neritina]|uniref:Uncharacterized protein n=1 Tax=Bugula neritina TaxID=10212 RepID=A0A7J7KPW3_BUGNE|nr:hypothetical protein EB796_001444 [Bugula neritina]